MPSIKQWSIRVKLLSAGKLKTLEIDARETFQNIR